MNETVDATMIAAASDTSTPEIETGRFCMTNQYEAAAVATVIPVCRRLNKSLYHVYSGSLYPPLKKKIKTSSGATQGGKSITADSVKRYE
ncbi:hypothetical protein HNQ05_000245 [Oceanithermus desulfurans]|nr:hypothetical protein [Oceanithermus desulfurans]MBB6028895.1 hypothetical protein [Oceanithermus desulfurans]